MENNQESIHITPPGLISSISEGFNIVANNIHLILLPLTLDVFLWLGPHLRIKSFLRPFIFQVLSDAPKMSTPELGEMSKWSGEIWDFFLEHFNLISLVRAYPLGVPSLMANLAPIDTPLGPASLIEITNFFQVGILWISFTLFGILLGSFFFETLSRATDENVSHFSFRLTVENAIQVFLFTLIFFILLFFFLFPTLLLILFLSFISPALGQIAFILIGIILIWFIMPLVFSIHGVFVDHQPLYNSIGTSIRLVRNYLPGTGMFILMTILLYQGLNLLWETAPATSWMSIAGIFGHAFISTGLISASFVYYRKGLSWMKSKLHPITA
ncbi:MAG: hypothetical protein GX640_05575 [Fibrobacter sp.]|nr:hypothetical protein [Fibrobacter sp.]